MSGNKLYIYTNKTYQEKGWLKVGQSITPENRIRTGKTSSPQALVLQEVFDLPKGYRDHHVHEELKSLGFLPLKLGGGKEWFETTIADVRRAYHGLVHKEYRANSYKLRPEQCKAVEQASNWFKKKYPKITYQSASHPDRFLLNAKMRFGKCFTGIHIAKEISAKRVLVVTFKPEVLTEWMEAVNDHLDFTGWTGIRARKNKKINELYIDENGNIPKVEGPLVVCVSLQDLWIDENSKSKKRLQKIVANKWDLIIFDEVHYGSLTDRSAGVLDKLKYTRRLDLSGTPFRLLEMEDFCKEQIYSYSYLDEQINKKNSKNPIYKSFPDLDFSTIEITEEDLDSQLEEFRNQDLEMSLNKLFESSKNQFKHENAVDHFIDGLRLRNRSATSISVFGSLAGKLGLPVKRHSVWWVRSVSTANALAKKLKEHEYFRSFEIVNAAGCGSETKTEDAVEVLVARGKEHVVAAINKSNRDSRSLGTITITVRRFLTGVTIKEWDSMLILNDIESPEEYYQAIFRIQTPWIDELTKEVVKKKAWIFDFSLTRCLMMKVPLADAIASERIRSSHLIETGEDNLREVTQELCDAFSLKSYVDGRLVPDKLTAKQVFSAINIGAARGSLARRITSDALINCIPLALIDRDPSILEILEKIKGYRTQDIGTISQLVKIGKIEKRKRDGKTTGDRSSKTSLNKKQKEIRHKVITQIKRLAIAMSDFIYMTKEREHCIGQVIETKESDFFQVVTGITKSDFKKLCKWGFIRKEKLNSIVRDFYHQEYASLKSDEFVAKSISRQHKK